MEKRIYGKKFEINTEKTRMLYNKRAENLDNMQSVYTSVLLGDQNPEYADEWDAAEKKLILPFLNVSEESAVLDIGCGIGRWAECLMPVCKSYIGVDFSSEMTAAANKRCAGSVSDCKRFICSSAQDYLSAPADGEKPNIIIVSYVCMYINDSEIENAFRNILKKADRQCVLYFIDTVALNERLTLNEIYSEALRSDYSALYRTVDEYSQLFEIFTDAGFGKTDEGFMPKLNNEAQYSETDSHYTTLKKT